MSTPLLLDKELKVDPNSSYTSCTDQAGIIVTVNDAFAELSGYRKNELLGSNHNIVRHPEMPKIIFEIMWEKLGSNQKFVGLIKNRAYDGKYYWLLNEISVMSKKESKVYYAYKKAAPKRGVYHIGRLYRYLLEEEQRGGLEASRKYLDDFLAFRGVTYDEYLQTLVDAQGLLKGSYFITRKLFS
jgi:PAS domain S-box-containing protein